MRKRVVLFLSFVMLIGMGIYDLWRGWLQGNGLGS
jgi:hypothetical protein